VKEDGAFTFATRDVFLNQLLLLFRAVTLEIVIFAKWGFYGFVSRCILLSFPALVWCREKLEAEYADAH
jgi:hypothetical protein